MGYFTGKTIIITGAGFAALKDGSAGSIGFGIATAFAKEGANLAITGRNVKKLEAAKERLEGEFGIRVLPIQADVNAQADNQAVVQSAVDQVIAEFGRIDALVNNAQASASGVTIADHTTAQFDLALYSGLYAAFYYMQACYPHLKETKGSVVNFASGAGLFGNYGQCAYAAAKEGIRGLTRVAATEWGPDGINANVVCPLAWTAALENFKEQYPEAYEANVHMPPMGHYGNVETEIGRAVVQLCGPDFVLRALIRRRALRRLGVRNRLRCARRHLQILVNAARQVADMPIYQGELMIGDAFHQEAVVRDQKQRARPCVQQLLDGGQHVGVHVVARLVQDEHVGLVE